MDGVSRKYYKTRDVANETGLPIERVRELCHTRGANFAYRVKKNGQFLIDLEKFRTFIERHRDYKKEVYLYSVKDLDKRRHLG